jgi:hypothetical protein
MAPEPQPDSDNRKASAGRGSFRIWKEPLIHFFVLGLAVFGLHRLLEKRPEVVEDPFLVEVSSGDLEWFRTMFKKRTGREPTVVELRGEVNQLIRERILSREATQLGLDEDDVVVRRRLAQKMDFLFQDISELDEPSDDELRAYLREKRGTYETPGRMTFVHVYFNTDERGDDEAAEAARKLVEKLNTSEGAPQDTSSLGDRFLLPASYSDKSFAEIHGLFGPRFAESVWDQEVGMWHGPVRSGYGLHAVRVEERSDATLPDFHELKERLTADWIAERQRELSNRVYKELRARYRVLVEGMPYDMDIGG